MTKQELVKQVRECVNAYNFTSTQTTASNVHAAKRLYTTIFMEKGPLFPNNPNPDAKRTELSMMMGCGKCEETIFRELKKWYTFNK